MIWKRNDLPSPNATPASSPWVRRARKLALCCALGAGLLWGGCADKQAAEQTVTTTLLSSPAAECPVTVDLADWRRFHALAQRAVAPGTEVTVAEWSDLLDRPGFLAWRESYRTDKPTAKTPQPRRLLGDDAATRRRSAPNPLSSQLARADLPDDKEFVIEAIGYIFDRSAGTEGRRTGSGIGNALRIEYNYALQHTDRIEDHAAELVTPERSCDLWRRLRRWIDPDRLPDRVDLVVVPMDRQFIQDGDRIFVGTNVLAAGYPAQLVRQLAGMYYDEYQAIPGPDPQLVDGQEVVAQLCRLLLNQGLKGHIAEVVKAGYDRDHPRLRDFNPIPEVFYERGTWLIDVFNKNLPRLLADPTEAERLAGDFITMIRQLNGINMGSYCMAETIVAQFGPDRLHASRTSVAEFLRTYQEAALRNPRPLARPGEIGRPYHECMPPFEEAVLADLLTLVDRYFPES